MRHETQDMRRFESRVWCLVSSQDLLICCSDLLQVLLIDYSSNLELSHIERRSK
jgi:hypothetical protein